MDLRKTLDSWKNALIGLGGRRDKRSFARFERDTPLDDETLDALYHDNDLAATICDVLPEDGLRRGIIVKIAPKEDKAGEEEKKDQADGPDLQTEIQMRLDELKVIPKTTDAAVWGNVFGAGAIFLGADDGSSPEKPLNLENVSELKFLTVLDKRDLQAERWYADPLDVNYGKPSHYRFTNYLTSRETSGPVRPNIIVHESRLCFFYGSRTSKRKQLENNGWPLSKLQRVHEVLRDFEMGWAGAALLLQEASQAVYGVKGLLDIIGSEQGQELMEKRMGMIEMSRSVARALVIDADGESFERKPVTFTGIPDLLDRFCQRLSAATHIPITRLMGTSPTGLQATGDSDQRNWNKQVKSYQEQILKPALEKIVLLLLLEKGPEPEQWSVEFPPLSEPTEKELAETRKIVADTDVAYINAGVYTPEECALSRFTADGWSMETTIDLNLREELDEIEKENQLTLKEDPPELQEQEGKRKALDAPPEPKTDSIRKTAKGYQVISESGKPLSADNLSKAQAEKRLAEIEYFKHKKG